MAGRRRASEPDGARDRLAARLHRRALLAAPPAVVSDRCGRCCWSRAAAAADARADRLRQRRARGAGAGRGRSGLARRGGRGRRLAGARRERLGLPRPSAGCCRLQRWCCCRASARPRAARAAPALRRPDPPALSGRRQTVAIAPGMSVLEASRSAGIPHASVCGGRGRCSTCRIRVGEGAAASAAAGRRRGPGAGADRRRRRQRAPRLPAAADPRSRGRAAAAGERRPARGARPGQSGPGGRARDRGAVRRSARLHPDGRGPPAVRRGVRAQPVLQGDGTGDRERRRGRVDKFIGDGIMALFGIDLEPADACRRALAGARAMALALDDAQPRARARPARAAQDGHRPARRAGDPRRDGLPARSTSLTAIGDAVNVASRLEALTKELGAQLVVSAALAERAGRRPRELRVAPRSRSAAAQRPLRVRVVADARSLPLGDAAAAPRPWRHPGRQLIGARPARPAPGAMNAIGSPDHAISTAVAPCRPGRSRWLPASGRRPPASAAEVCRSISSWCSRSTSRAASTRSRRACSARATSRRCATRDVIAGDPGRHVRPHRADLRRMGGRPLPAHDAGLDGDRGPRRRRCLRRRARRGAADDRALDLAQRRDRLRRAAVRGQRLRGRAPGDRHLGRRLQQPRPPGAGGARRGGGAGHHDQRPADRQRPPEPLGRPAAPGPRRLLRGARDRRPRRLHRGRRGLHRLRLGDPLQAAARDRR